ncbi:MAG: hypothetical protein MZV63_13495 [Marinilabiliales bacterium]|nr:hypothetical protein [Marinilabiliales bacterium]
MLGDTHGRSRSTGASAPCRAEKGDRTASLALIFRTSSKKVSRLRAFRGAVEEFLARPRIGYVRSRVLAGRPGRGHAEAEFEGVFVT